MAEDNTAGVEASNPVLGSIKIRGTDLVSVLSLLLGVTVAIVLYQHLVDTKANGTQFVAAIKEMTDAQQKATKEQRLLTCIVSRPEAERRREFGDSNSFCQQVGR